MNEKPKSTESPVENDSSVSELVLLNLNEAKEKIKSEPAWLNGDRNAITLFKSEGLRIIMMAFHTGAELKAHKAPGIITVQVLDGEITFRTEKQESNLKKGEMLTLPKGIVHSVLALKETVFLLTIAVDK